jgi:murein DD-endopeptidase MepM/ murein hydrolase activator NlpD
MDNRLSWPAVKMPSRKEGVSDAQGITKLCFNYHSMNKHYAVTISDRHGSKHFFLKSTIKRNIVVAGVAASLMAVFSVTANLLQQRNSDSLTFEKTRLVTDLAVEKRRLNEELIRFDNHNSKLGLIIAGHEEQVDLISRALVEIEKISGVDTGDQVFALEERLKIIGQFYNAKEEEYSFIGSRVDQIEDVIGLDNETDGQHEVDLTTRVQLASLTASQERILHDSIPSGYPTVGKVITSKFGNRKHPVTKVNSFHKGVDMRAKTGEKLYATADGFISNADYSELSGNRIVIMHNFGFETRYSHLKEILVSPGDVVHKGDLIGHTGNTGRSSAPHLHYEIRYLGKATNPYEFLKWEFGTNDIFTQVRGIKWPSLLSLINKQITHQTLQLSLLDRTYQAE